MKYELKYKRQKDITINDMDDLTVNINKIKNKIDINPEKWSLIKKIIHDYEYIYTSQNPSKNIAKCVPFSRSYFKLKEMINVYDILKNRNNLNIFCIAEAPGGFIQCFLDYTDIVTKIIGTSLLSVDKSIPYWNKKLLNEPKIEFKYGVNNDGDICELQNILSLIKDNKNKYDIITADGGFDYSTDYNSQERDSLKLIYSEIFLALNTQKEGGIFICKLFDTFLKETIYLINCLSHSYEKIYFHKPAVSRYSNSEKYIVCIGYKGYNKDLINILFRGLVNKIEYVCDENFLNSIRLFNEYYLEEQTKKINEGVNLFNKSLYVHPTKKQLNMTLGWCKQNNIEINENCYYL